MVGIGGIADMNGWVASANSVECDPKAVINQIKIAQCSGLLPHRAWL